MFAPSVAGVFLCLAATTLALPTWPDDTDDLEQAMYVVDGRGKQGMTDAIFPCSFGNTFPGQINAAEWLRTAYHDMATADVIAGTGGLDSSAMFETNRPENIGSAINNTYGFLKITYNAHTSMSDTLAVGIFNTILACGGPALTVRTGRIDATEAGPSGVPEPQENITTLTDKFARQGFNQSEMIALVACGHTLGGVHGSDFPTIVPGSGNAGNNISHFDTTIQFDNLVATEYVAGNTTSPLVVGADSTMNSDLRVFGSDGNATIKSLTDPAVFRDRCASLLTRMIDTVPASVTLSEPLLPYEVKPISIFMELSADASNISFAADIRVRTTNRPTSSISSVQLHFTDLNGTVGTIDAPIVSFMGSSVSLSHESFQTYEVDTVLPASTRMSSFNVSVTLTNGTVELFDNNGVGYPASTDLLVSRKRSCQSNENAPLGVKLVATVRGSYAPGEVKLVYNLPTSRPGTFVPLYPIQNLTMTSNATVGDFHIYSAQVPQLASQTSQLSFDLVAGSGENELSLKYQHQVLIPDC